MPNSLAIPARLQLRRLYLSCQAIRVIMALSSQVARMASSSYLLVAPLSGTRSNAVWLTSTTLSIKWRSSDWTWGRVPLPLTVASPIPWTTILVELNRASGLIRVDGLSLISPLQTRTVPIWQMLEGSAFAVSLSIASNVRFPCLPA